MYLFDFDSEKIDKDSIFDNLSHLEVELSELQADLHRAKLHRTKELKRLGIPKSALSECPDQLPQSIIDLNNQIDEMEEIRAQKKKEKDRLESKASKFKVFDKEKTLKNIRYLVSHSSVKIGQIEKQACVRPGYMSIIEKPDSTTEPSIQFVTTAAKLLETSLDELVFGKLYAMTDVELYLRDFFRDLINDTRKHDIHWEKELDGALQGAHMSGDYSSPPDHPLFSSVPDNLQLRQYCSKFYPGQDIVPDNGAYHASLSKLECTVYLVPCHIEEEKFFESYLVSKDGTIKPLCATRKASNGIMTIFNELFKTAIADASSVYLDKETMSIIDQYRSLRKEEQE